MTARIHICVGVVLIAIGCWCVCLAAADPELTSSSLPLDSNGMVETGSVRLPDQPGTVPLQEESVEARVDRDVGDRREVPTPATVRRQTTKPPPPLSLQDCQAALRWGATQSTDSSADPMNPGEPVFAMLEDVLAYLRIQDDRHSSLAQYEWVFGGRNKVNGDPLDEDVYDSGLLQDVSAIAFEAEYDDVYLRYVGIIDDDDRMAAEYHLDPPRLLRAGLPRREVFHLYFPTDVSKVVVRYEPVESNGNPRVTLYGGVAEEREYLKQAQFYVLQAEKALQAGTPAIAADMMAKADNRITRFLEHR